MRILTVSDKVEPVLYSSYVRQRVGQIDLILACGDLPYYYLEFIVSSLDVPLYFVHGNHDLPVPRPAAASMSLQEITPGENPGAPIDWATNLHGRTVEHDGLLLAGLEGCRVYNPGARFQYTETQVAWQAFRLAWRLRLNRLRRGRYIDILVTHAPPYGIHDAHDVAHTGFYTYLELMRQFCPTLLIHGHYHVYNRSVAMDTDYQGVHVVNTYGYRVIDLAARPEKQGWEVISTTH